MKKISLKIKIIVLSLFVVGACSAYVFINDTDKQKEQMVQVMRLMIQNHYSVPEIDDDFSEKVFSIYIKNLDYNKRFFTATDSVELSSYKYKVDDDIFESNYLFFEKVNSIYEQRLNNIASSYKAILAKPFDFNIDETIEIDHEKRNYAKDENALNLQWKKYFKYQVLIQVKAKIDQQEKAKLEGDTSVQIKSFKEIEEEVRTKLSKDTEEMFKRLTRETKMERFSEFVNAVVHAFDPHSDFFPPKEKESFDIQMSGKLEGIGATLQERAGYIKIVSIVPGSPSYKQGDLKPEDLILKVAQGDQEPVDIVDMPLDEAVRLIRGKKGTTVKLTIKKPDGSILVVPIVRDVIVLEEAYAKSLIITDQKSKKKVGFIQLPSFYADFNNRNGRFCAEDIKKELVKLKAENVDGIILDLRNNGGGSLQDVVTMGGYFIEKGPIVQIQTKGSQTYVLDDKDASVLYDGPLVILVNQFSASASEILAAAMQDYKRAVIIGSNRTFGKGTVQRMYELSNGVGTEYLGSAKITVQKFYRINGGSTQLNGVVPDIIVPDLYAFLDIGEKEMDYVMPWDQIAPASYNLFTSPVDIKKVQEKSSQRIISDTIFEVIRNNASFLKEKQKNTSYSLNLEKYSKEIQNTKSKEERLEYKILPFDNLSFTMPKTDIPSVKDTINTVRNKEFIKRYENDPYLNEAIQVIKDLK